MTDRMVSAATVCLPWIDDGRPRASARPQFPVRCVCMLVRCLSLYPALSTVENGQLYRCPVPRGPFRQDLSYPGREDSPEWGGLRDMAGGLLGVGNLVDMATGLVMGNPASAAMKVAKDGSLPAGRRIGAGATAGAMALGNMLGGPAAGILGLLGGFFNSLGFHQDTDEVTGNIAMSRGGTLSGDTSGPGGSFYQSGSLNNFNFFDALAATPPNAIVCLL